MFPLIYDGNLHELIESFHLHKIGVILRPSAFEMPKNSHSDEFEDSDIH